MYKEIYFSFNKNDYFKYLFISIGIFLVIQNFSVVNTGNIIAIIITIALVKLLVDKKVLDDYSKLEHINKDLIKINIDKYKYIAKEIDIINIIVYLSPLSKKNRVKFNSFVKHIDNFFYIYEISFNINYNNAELYELAKDEAKHALNLLLSFYIDTDVYPTLVRDRTVIEDRVISESTNIKDSESRIRNIFTKYLNEMEININREWNSGDINIYSKPVYPDAPDSSIDGDVLYNRHLSIY